MRCYLHICSVLYFLITVQLCAQSSDTTLKSTVKDFQDLKVGLVLSGGGAKGLAHIGVLKVLEQQGIRVDYIGGASMGAIIGGLYASGYSARQLEDYFTNVNFKELIQDEVSRASKTFYERDQDERYLLRLPFNHFKVSLPKGLSKGQNIFNAFSKFTAHVNHIHDFSKLPIPFLCSVTDVGKGESVILEKGYLPQAVLASGSLPSLFRPVEINGNLYSDGGIMNNFPVEQVKDKGMDVIIGVDVQDDLMEQDKITSITALMQQISNLGTIEEMRNKKHLPNIYIKPDITDFTLLSFDRVKEIILEGEKAAKLYIQELKNLSKKQQIKSTNLPVVTRDSLTVNSMFISGNKHYTRSYIAGKLKLKIPSRISYERFNEGINNLSSTGNFEHINYKIESFTDDHQVLLLDVIENPVRNLLKLGFHYDPKLKTSLLVNFTTKNTLVNNGVFSFDVILGDNFRYNIEYYIDKGYSWSFGIKHYYNYFSREVSSYLYQDFVFTDFTPMANIRFSEFNTTIFAQTLLGRSSLLHFGLEHLYIRSVSNFLQINPDFTSDVRENYTDLLLRFRLDRLDDLCFPTKGLYVQSDTRWYFGSDRLYENLIFRLDACATFPLHRVLSFQSCVDLGMKLTPTSNSLDFVLGGFGGAGFNNHINLWGYDFLARSGNGFTKLTQNLFINIHQKHHLSLGFNAAYLTNGTLFRAPQDTVFYLSGYTLGYGLDSIIGPLRLNYTYSPETKNTYWYLNIGFNL